MKLYLTSLFILLGITLSQAQSLAYGITAGTNFTSGGKITGNSITENGEVIYWTGTSQGQSKTGYHGGGFAEVEFGDFFIRPEVVYTSLKSEFIFPNKSSVYSVQKLDLPLLVGYNFGSIAGLYAGPVYSPMIENKLEHKESTVIKYEEYTDYIPGQSLTTPSVPLNIQIGLKSEFNQFGFDLRYEYGFSSEPEKVDMLNSKIGRDKDGINIATVEDSNLSQIILSVTYKFTGTEDSGRRGSGSYSRRRRTR